MARATSIRHRTSGLRLVLLFWLVCGNVVGSAVQVDTDPRLKRVLPNGATVLVERFEKSAQLSVQLVASSAGAEDTADTHGWRHLLEHMILKGLDKDLESRGMFLTASTTRDAMRIEVSGSADGLKQALASLSAILRPLGCTAQDLAAEARIMREEFALDPRTRELLASAWRLAFGESGLDPQGCIAAISKATPDALETLRQRHFTASNVVLVVSGPIDVDRTLQEATAVLERLPVTSTPNNGLLAVAATGKVGTSTQGAARAVVVQGLGKRETAWALSAGMALAARGRGAIVVYTPSAARGLATLISDSELSLIESVDGVQPDERDELFRIGRSLALGWLRGQLSTPSRSAALRGLMLCRDPNAQPETIRETLLNMTEAQFQVGLDLFSKDRAFQVHP